VTGNSWGCKKVSGNKTTIFFGLVAAYWDQLYCSLIISLHESIRRVFSQSIHKLLQSYPQTNENKACILIFLQKPKKNNKRLIYMKLIFVELEINMWITIYRCR
jgi:hypothetical protein